MTTIHNEITFLQLPNELQLLVIRYLNNQFISKNLFILKTIYPIYKTIIQDKIRHISQIYDILFKNDSDAYLFIWKKYDKINGCSKYILNNFGISEYLFKRYCLENNFCPLYRYKVKIKAHTWSMGAEQFQEANGVILSMQEFKSTVLYKDQRGSIDQIRVGTFNNRLLIITDERASELLS